MKGNCISKLHSQSCIAEVDSWDLKVHGALMPCYCSLYAKHVFTQQINIFIAEKGNLTNMHILVTLEASFEFRLLLSVYLDLSVRPSVCLYFCPCVFLSIHPSVLRMFVHLSFVEMSDAEQVKNGTGRGAEEPI